MHTKQTENNVKMYPSNKRKTVFWLSLFCLKIEEKKICQHESD